MPKATQQNPKQVEETRKARSNLRKFNLDEISAELDVVESQTLGFDPSSRKRLAQTKPENDSKTSIKMTDKTPKASQFKQREVNVVEFTPDGSKLLHQVLRTAPSKEPEKSPSKSSSEPTEMKSSPKKPKSPFAVSVKVPPKKVLGDAKGSLTKATLASVKTSGTASAQGSKPQLNTTSVALKGLKQAGEFNHYSLSKFKTSMHSQIEKESIFSKSFDDPKAEVYDAGLQTKPLQKVYNVKQRKNMLGGVHQHNLGPGKARRTLSYRSVKLLLPVFIALVGGLYVAYLNVPTINVKIAESRSGLAVSEPSYTPDGFKLDSSVEAETGRVSFSFSNGQDQSYSVSQKITEWDSKALLENKVLKETKEYSAYTDRGLTIYVYDGKATWVNQGKINEISLDGAQLDVEDIIRIAGSM